MSDRVSVAQKNGCKASYEPTFSLIHTNNKRDREKSSWFLTSSCVKSYGGS
ncbi:Inositol 1,4,5-trisphosphate receptor, partial [Danaus plexippus plexippus]